MSDLHFHKMGMIYMYIHICMELSSNLALLMYASSIADNTFNKPATFWRKPASWQNSIINRQEFMML